MRKIINILFVQMIILFLFNLNYVPKTNSAELIAEEMQDEYKVVEETIVNKLDEDQKMVEEVEGKKIGDIGRLYIPSVGYQAAVYNCSGKDYYYKQRITDNKDSASYITVRGKKTAYIGDHNTDGFENMKKSIPDTTYAYIFKDDGTVDTYVCMEKHTRGRYTGTVYDENGTEIFNSNYDIAMVTCNGSYLSVTITYWNKI